MEILRRDEKVMACILALLFALIIIVIHDLPHKGASSTNAPRPGYSAKVKSNKLYPPSGGSNVRKND